MPEKSFRLLSGGRESYDLLKRNIWIDYSIDWRRFNRISWKDLPSILAENSDLFRGKMVLVGGEYEGSQDFHRIPRKRKMTDNEVSGMVISALILNTLLKERPILHFSGSTVSIFIVIVLLAFFIVSLIQHRIFPSLLLLLIVMIIYLLSAYFLFMLEAQILPVGIPLIIFVMTMIVATFIRKKLTFLQRPSKEAFKT